MGLKHVKVGFHHICFYGLNLSDPSKGLKMAKNLIFPHHAAIYSSFFVFHFKIKYRSFV